jgi:hypothetical protein
MLGEQSKRSLVEQKLTCIYRRGLEPDLANVEKHATILASRLDVYEKILSKQKYLAGDILTIADTFHLTYGDMVVNVCISLSIPLVAPVTSVSGVLSDWMAC